MILVRALRLAAENRALRENNTRLVVALRGANDTTERAVRRCQQLDRDLALVALMARDREMALDFVRTAHRIDQLPEGTL